MRVIRSLDLFGERAPKLIQQASCNRVHGPQRERVLYQTDTQSTYLSCRGIGFRMGVARWAKLSCFKKYYHHLHRPDTGRCGLVVILFHKRSDALLGSNLGFELGPLVAGAVAGSRWAGGDPPGWINYSGLRGAD